MDRLYLACALSLLRWGGTLQAIGYLNQALAEANRNGDKVMVRHVMRALSFARRIKS